MLLGRIADIVLSPEEKDTGIAGAMAKMGDGITGAGAAAALAGPALDAIRDSMSAHLKGGMAEGGVPSGKSAVNVAVDKTLNDLGI